MNIELIKAILHVLDPAVDAPILSEAILPPSEDALQYLAGHAAKCFASDEAKAWKTVWSAGQGVGADANRPGSRWWPLPGRLPPTAHSAPIARARPGHQQPGPRPA